MKILKSVQGREVLIKGARGILQGTSDLLLTLDQGEVRKLVKQVRAVLDCVGLADQVARMEDVVIFVKSLTPTITRVGRERGNELTSQVHRDLLIGSLERATNATPQVSFFKLKDIRSARQLGLVIVMFVGGDTRIFARVLVGYLQRIL